jgi:anti-anti-sigma factor
LNITATPHGPVTVVAIDGSVDSLNAEQLTQALTEHLAAGCRQLVVDLGAVPYTSTAGLRALLAAVKDSRRLGGDLRLAAAQASVERVLSLSGFTGIIKTYRGVTEAVASFAPGG